MYVQEVGLREGLLRVLLSWRALHGRLQVQGVSQLRNAYRATVDEPPVAVTHLRDVAAHHPPAAAQLHAEQAQFPPLDTWRASTKEATPRLVSSLLHEKPAASRRGRVEDTKQVECASLAQRGKTAVAGRPANHGLVELQAVDSASIARETKRHDLLQYSARRSND